MSDYPPRESYPTTLDWLTAYVGGIWQHKTTRHAYRLLDVCKIKQQDGSWIDGVIYTPELTMKTTYIREVEDFAETFELTDPVEVEP